MASNADSTNTSETAGFSALKGYERRAVILRYEGKSYMQIANNLADEFAVEYSDRTIGDWFIAGGKLEVAYHELMDLMAAQSLKEAKQVIRRASKAAAATLVDQLKSTADPNIRQGAAKALLNKYIPDKQITLDGPGLEEDLPEALSGEADKIVAEVENGPNKVDEPQQGEDNNQPAGPTSS